MKAQNPLPTAEPAQVRRAAARLIRLDARGFAAMLLSSAAAAAVGLASPWLLGRIVDEVTSGGSIDTVDRLALGILVAVAAQLVLARWAAYAGARFGERTLARIREQLVERVLALPVGLVERAGIGDLTARGTTDATLVGTTLRDVAPDVLIAVVRLLFVFAAMVALHPLLGACGLLGLLGMLVSTRWYLRRAPAAYLAEGTANSALAEQLTATVAGARTIEAFRLAQRRRAVCEKAVDDCRRTRLNTLGLRSVLFPTVSVSYVVPVIAILLAGGLLHGQDVIGLGAVVTGALYARQLEQPLDVILFNVEQLQSSGASFARIEGLAVADAAAVVVTAREPADDRIEVSGVSFAYGGRDVLRDIDLTVRPGERLAIVGPSGAGKTTLSRLLAGIEAPNTGDVTVGGVPVVALVAEQLRRHVVLVTQEHHVFLGTVRDNLAITLPAAKDAELWRALDAAGAEWVHATDDGLDTTLGGSGLRIDGAQAQQLAMARVVLADPHTLILDEATALLDPRTARHTEHALAAVLAGRTLIAIAHRLHTAHDADRVAVMQDGQIVELGTHDELVSASGAYAALWKSWHG